MIYSNETYNIIGAAMRVHNALKRGFSEYVYQDALEIELRDMDVPFEREKKLQVFYKGHILSHVYIADFVCYEKIIVELKAVSNITGEHRSQLLNYLHVLHLPLGLLINFGQDSLQYERIVNFDFKEDVEKSFSSTD